VHEATGGRQVRTLANYRLRRPLRGLVRSQQEQRPLRRSLTRPRWRTDTRGPPLELPASVPTLEPGSIIESDDRQKARCWIEGDPASQGAQGRCAGEDRRWRAII